MQRFLLPLILTLWISTSFGQHSTNQETNWFASAKPTNNLFVHFDKNVYSNNETVYFTGYIVKEGTMPIAQHTVMAIALIREIDSVLISEDKFLMNKGISFGSLTLPDSIPTGNYRFLVYTDKLANKLPDLLFVQNITIKSNIEPTFKASLKLVEQGDIEIKSHKILISTSTLDGRFLKKPVQISYSYGKIKKNASTDASGQFIITLPIQNELVDPNVYVKLKHGKDSTFINTALPPLKNKGQVKFYPEGGNIVNGLSSNVAWEVRDQQNRPMALKAFLFKNLEVIDTIETGSYGIGSFMLKPEIGFNYSIKLIHSNLADSSYTLPKALNSGLVLTLPNAFVTDTLKINLKSTNKINVKLVIHNLNRVYSTIPINFEDKNSVLKLPLLGLPKGLTTLTVVDTLNRPLAERVFFAHYNATEKVTISSNKESYTTREKVILKLNLQHDENALVSIAIVQDNRLDQKKMNDIESYTYLHNELITVPISGNGRAFKDRNYLEQVLLVKGWRKYSWQGIEATRTAEMTVKIDSLKISGKVSRLKREITDSLVIGTMGSQGVNLIRTTSSGLFNLDKNQLITPATKKMYVFVNEAKKLPYLTKIEIKDDFSILNQKLAKVIHSDQVNFPSNLANNIDLLLKNNEKLIRLKEVEITNKSDNRFIHSPGPNACGDYYCISNYLNCPFHVGASTNRPPVKGNSYIVYGSRFKKIYAGCTVPEQNSFTLVKGIHLEKEFYHSDYKDPNEPAFFSTIYWNYGMLLNANKETELSFYTSDITGKFRVVLQGITDKDVIYAEHFFETKKESK